MATPGDEPRLAVLVGELFSDRKEAETTHRDAPCKLRDRLALLIG